VVKRFEDGPFADRVPLQVEAPFALVLAGQVVRGRIDAVYAERDPATGADGYLVVDWKTNQLETADPLQLALYRLAWAELTGVAPERVRAVFHYVRTGRTVEPRDLPGRAELEELLSAAPVQQ
jgi:DNA helicase-2/ATP-dependent DNA helicase PcrA